MKTKQIKKRTTVPGTAITLLGATFITVIALILSSGCAGTSPREVVLLDSRGVAPTPYAEPGDAAVAREEPVREAPWTEEEPLPPIESLLPADEQPEIPELDIAAPELPDPEVPETPRIPEPPPVETEELTYTVQPGDSLWTISQRYGISHQELASYNNMDPDDVLVADRELRIPPGGRLLTEEERRPTRPTRPTPTETRPEQPDRELRAGDKYTVRRGDSLSVIAQDFGVRVSDIRALNDLTGDVIYEGQTLVIPETETTPTRDPEPTVAEEPDDMPATVEEELPEVELETEDFEETVEPIPDDDELSVINHVVTDEDRSLNDIAQMYAIDVEAIRRHNPGITDQDLRPDMNIKIPIF